MSETKETADRTLRGDTRKPLSLKRTVESGHVRQSFSHGRSKSVVVEKKKKRTISGSGGTEVEEQPPKSPQVAEAERLLAEAIQKPGSLSTDEIDKRRRALEIERERAEAEEAERARLEALRPPPSATPVLEQPPVETAQSPQPVAEIATPPAEKAKMAEAPRRVAEQPVKRGRALEVEPETEDDSRAKKKGAKAPKTPVKTGEERRERTKLTINNAFDEAQRERSLASLRRKREREKLRQAGVVQPRDKVMREVIIPEVLTIQELANRMTERSVDVIKLLMTQGAMHKINDVIDADTAELVVREFGHTPKRVAEADVEEGFIGQTDTDEALEPRAPVVTIMAPGST
jgi:translation initiation factor IF-2